MLAGASKTDITPPLGTDLTGYIARPGPSIGVHDPLYCRALVLGDRGTSCALIECDVLGFGVEYTRQVKHLIEKETGIPAGNVMLAATHTHSGPASVFLQGCGELAVEWLDDLPGKIVEAVQTAQSDLEEVQMAVGRQVVPGVAINRRDAGGPVDEELTAVWLTDVRGKSKAVLLHFACHAVVMGAENREVSADFPGAACASVEKALGGSCMYLQGPCGDINPALRLSFEAVVETGEKLAAAALGVVEMGGEGVVVGPGELSSKSQSLRLPLGQAPSFHELVELRREHDRGLGVVEPEDQRDQARMHRAMKSWAQRTIEACCSGLLQREVPVEVQCLELGNLLVIGVPGELFVEFGIEAKRKGRELGKHVLVVAYANGDIGYIPTPDSYEVGGYEVEWAYRYYGYPAALSAGAGARIGEAIETFVAGK